MAAALALLLASGLMACGSDNTEQSASDVVIEPAAEIGPDAFTAPVTSDTSICDKQKLVQELQSRPDANREWARVLGVRQEDVPTYIQGLTPIVLASDTRVTNHGLRDGHAYARNSVLTAGTAVLVASSAAGSTTTTAVTSGVPVTRCKCGNPLLPAAAGGASTTTPTTGSTGTTRGTVPGTNRPGTTSSSSSTSSPPSSSSSTTSSVPPSSSSTVSSSSTSTTATAPPGD